MEEGEEEFLHVRASSANSLDAKWHLLLQHASTEECQNNYNINTSAFLQEDDNGTSTNQKVLVDAYVRVQQLVNAVACVTNCEWVSV